MTVAVIGSSHVCRLRDQLEKGSIYPGVGLNNFPTIEWFGKSGLTAEDLANLDKQTTREWRDRIRRLQPEVACLMVGANDLDRAADRRRGIREKDAVDVLKYIREVVQWLKPLVGRVLIVPLWHRQYPRNRSCHFRHRYPGRADYTKACRNLNKKLYAMGEMGVRMTPTLKLKNADLSDCIHLKPAANKKLLNVLRKEMRKPDPSAE
jgi:lysophospholipase L1-like esterase